MKKGKNLGLWMILAGNLIFWPCRIFQVGNWIAGAVAFVLVGLGIIIASGNKKDSSKKL